MSTINQDWGNQGNKKVELIEDLWGRGLSSELLELLLSKLKFVVDIQKFHAVCKMWRSITVSPPRQPPSPLPYADSSFPLLFQFNRRDDSKYRILHPLYKYTWDLEFPPQLTERDFPPEFIGDSKRIQFSKYGWSLIMALWDPFPDLFLFNPLTREIKKFPTPPFFHGDTRCMFFTCPPSQPDCLVFAISDCSIYVHKLGEADWKKHDLNGKMDPSFKPICPPILYHGLCYCLDSNGNMGVFDMQDIEHSWTVHHRVLLPDILRARLIALVEHNGQLLVVLIKEERRHKLIYIPYIHKLDLKTKSCEPMQSLGNNALFISYGASFSQRAIVSGTGNKLFVPLFKNNTDSYMFYSLATSKYHSFFNNLSSDLSSDIRSSWLPM
ncbi:hypothetical protein COLO4_20290 [Corchorus olitorius]|uniref:KIB1-4 beta-propeller domain-containing protein n=1 Tax=Corchorus olitorius TaxID=93759 RepID=A0A1R3J0J0_9ROSI|nr:hypothetical protein COLO4_20290 [Corchorus olitorius]